MGLHTYTVGYGGVGLFILALLTDPAAQAAIVSVIQHPTPVNIVELVFMVAGILGAWLGKGPLSSKTPSPSTESK